METVEVAEIKVQPYSTTELAPFFNRSPRTFRRELAKIKHKYGQRIGHRWSIRQVEMIFADFGRPYQYKLIAA